MMPQEQGIYPAKEPEFPAKMIDSKTEEVKVQGEHGKSHCAKKVRKVSDQRMMGT